MMDKPSPARPRAIVLSQLAAGSAALFSAGSAMAEYALNLTEPVSSTAREILTLHNLILLICLVIFIVVFSVMFYSIFAHRKSRGAKAASFHHSTVLEIVWTAVPVLILFAIAIPSTATLIRMEDTTEADMTLKITGYQWFWEYEYLEDNVNFFSKLSTPRAQIEGREDKGENYLLEVDREVVLPINKKIRFLFSGADVIHSWWVPQLGVKKDAIPGYINESWVRIDEPGTYTGQCAELCGKDHGFMPIVVKAVTEQEYAQWVSENQSADPVDEQETAEQEQKTNQIADQIPGDDPQADQNREQTTDANRIASN